jgi:hypothetical protein
MQIQQSVFYSKEEILESLKNFDAKYYDLHFIFSHKQYLVDELIASQIQLSFANSIIMGCSSAGEIGAKKVIDESFVLTSVKFEKSKVKKASFALNQMSDSKKAGEYLANQLIDKNLKNVFILSDGLNVNGSRLIEGINSVLDYTVNVSGGLAGDNGDFIKTYVADMDNNFVSNCISAIGFYGEDLETSSGSFGGWDSFGIGRVVTKSIENVVYEIDGQPALELYKSYLGDLSKELPGSALFFPLEMKSDDGSQILVRTILGINEKDNSLTFAGNIAEGALVRLMKTNVSRVIDGAGKAALMAKEDLSKESKLVLMVSCVGRKLVLKQLAQDEIEAVTDSFASDAIFTGFYSYGELSKLRGEHLCNLHNQTMTLTAISEL